MYSKERMKRIHILFIPGSDANAEVSKESVSTKQAEENN